MLRETEAKRFAVLNKIDLLKKNKLLPLIDQYNRFELFDEIVPVSAATGDGVDELVRLFFEKVPAGPPRYPQGDFTTQPERFFAAEIVREKVLQHTSEELPYTTAVSVDKWEEDEAKNLIKIWATLVVEREATLGAKVFLDLHVAVHAQWREDERFLGDLEWPLRR